MSNLRQRTEYTHYDIRVVCTNEPDGHATEDSNLTREEAERHLRRLAGNRQATLHRIYECHEPACSPAHDVDAEYYMHLRLCLKTPGVTFTRYVGAPECDSRCNHEAYPSCNDACTHWPFQRTDPAATPPTHMRSWPA